MKTYLLLLMLIMFAFAVNAGSLCAEKQSLYALPCVLVTPIAYTPPCSAHNASIYLANGSLINLSSWLSYAGNYCYINFNQSVGTYMISSDTGDLAKIQVVSAQADVVNSEKPSMNFVIIVLTAIWLIFLFFSLKVRTKIMLTLNAVLTILIGIVFYFVLPEIGMLNVLLSFIMVLLGIIFLSYAMIGNQR